MTRAAFNPPPPIWTRKRTTVIVAAAAPRSVGDSRRANNGTVISRRLNTDSREIRLQPKLRRKRPRRLICRWTTGAAASAPDKVAPDGIEAFLQRSEEHTSELQSLMRISYAVFCLKKKTISKIKI